MQAELDARLSLLDVPPVVANRPHYGNSEDRPSKPPVFSGIQYRLPTNSVGELPPFSHNGGFSEMERNQERQSNIDQKVLSTS